MQEEDHDPVTATLSEMGFCVAPMRTILIQKGYFVGHKYRFDGGYTAWLIEKSAIEIRPQKSSNEMAPPMYGHRRGVYFGQRHILWTAPIGSWLAGIHSAIGGIILRIAATIKPAIRAGGAISAGTRQVRPSRPRDYSV
jgi:hypothetical protein